MLLFLARSGLLASASIARADRTRAEVVMSNNRLGTLDHGGPVPFDFVADSAIVFPVRVVGQTTLALLDTGAAVSVVSKELAQRSDLPLIGTRTLGGLVGSTRAARLARLDVEINGHIVRLDQATVADLGLVSSALGHPISLILGLDVFRKAAVDIDFSIRHLWLAPPGKAVGPAGSLAFPLTYNATGSPLVTASVEGHPPVPVILDLGSSSALQLSADYARLLGLLAGRRTSTAAIAGIDGMSISTSVTVKALDLQGVTMTDVPAECLDGWRPSGAVARIGMPVLSRFRVMTDFANDRVWLVPGPEAVATPFSKDRSGLGLSYRGDKLMVVHVSPGSPAAAGGWRAGDAIVAIEGHPVDAGYMAGQRWRWRYGPAGRSVRLELSSGERRVVTLADYY